MRVIADLHIHSRYSMATSQRMCVREIARFAKIKGLNVVGTGDFTHPKWLQELKETLDPDANRCLYKLPGETVSPVRFMITSEVSTVFSHGKDMKKVHHVVLTPSFETAIQINERLSKYGNLCIDGRPSLNTHPATLVEEVMEVSGSNMVFPAHVWTPWFSIFGAFSGFDSVDECYQDMTKHIYALETGLSSDPSMNWRLSKLDKFTLVSNSDSHSFWPWRIGREANVFELEDMAYREIIDAIKFKDKQRLKFTIETDPAYGKYHWTGHRRCNVVLSPQEAIKLANICPVCRKQLTKGVSQRVEELCDRPSGFKPADTAGFVCLLPLSEIISTVLGTDSPATQQVWNIYNQLIGRFGSEYAVLIDAPQNDICIIAGAAVADLVVKVRARNVKVSPGYDGVYGQLVVSEGAPRAKAYAKRVQQLNLADFVL